LLQTRIGVPYPLLIVSLFTRLGETRIWGYSIPSGI